MDGGGSAQAFKIRGAEGGKEPRAVVKDESSYIRSLSGHLKTDSKIAL